MTCGPQGVFSQVYIEPAASPHTFNGSSERYAFDICTIQKVGKQIVQRDNTGTRSMLKEQVYQGPYLCYGNLRMRMSAAMLDYWLPRILGASEVTDSFDVAETLQPFGVMKVVADGSGTIFREEFNDCVVSRAIIQGKATQFEEEEPEPVSLTLQIVGKSYAKDSQAVPSVSIPTASNYQPYMFEEGVFTINSVARNIYDFTLVIDNHVQVRYANALYPVSVCPTNRSVYLQLTMPADSTNINGLFAYPDAGYASATLVFTKGGLVTTFTLGHAEAADVSPEIHGQTEVPLQLTLRALKTGSTSELVVTNDSVA